MGDVQVEHVNVAFCQLKLGSLKNPVDENTIATLSPTLRFGSVALPTWNVTSLPFSTVS